MGDFAIVGGFEEGSVWGAFAGGVEAVGGVEEDEHKKRELVVSRFPFAKILIIIYPNLHIVEIHAPLFRT